MAQDERRVAADLNRRQGPLPAVDDWAPSPAEAPAVPAPPATDATAARPAKKGARAVREVVETLLLALVIFVAVRLVVLNFRVDGGSMYPNLEDREMLLVNRNAYRSFDLNNLLDLLPGEDRDEEWLFHPFAPPERGDIVVFEPPVESNKPYIKRIVALPGERVTFRNGDVYIDGEQLNEPYIEGGITECGGPDCTVTVGQGEVYVLGDNRENSSDSRAFGPIDVDQIVGKAWFAYWPLDEAGVVPHYDYPELEER